MPKKTLLVGIILIAFCLIMSSVVLADTPDVKTNLSGYSERVTVVVYGDKICEDTGCWFVGFGEGKEGKFLIFLDFEGTYEAKVNPLRDVLRAECGKKLADRQRFTFAVKPKPWLTAREALDSGKVSCGCKREALEWMTTLFCVKTFYLEGYYEPVKIE